MRGIVTILSGAMVCGLLPAGVHGSEVVVKAGKLTPVADGVAVLCERKQAPDVKGHSLPRGATPYVVSVSWQLAQAESVLITLSEDEASRMLLRAAGATYPPRAIGDDSPPPPPPGGRAAPPTDHWSKVTDLLPFKGGGRFVTMSRDWPRDFLFELPAAAAPPEALLFQATIAGREYSVRCDLGR